MKHALAALGMLLAWDILRPRRGTSRQNPRRTRRRRMREFHTCRPDGVWREFPDYRAFRRFLREQREKAAFIEGWNLALDNAAMKAYDMGRPDIREAINALVDPPRGPADPPPPHGLEDRLQGSWFGNQPQKSGTDEASPTAHACSKTEKTVE